MKTLMTWVKHHSETISLLIVVGIGMLGGIALGGVFITITSIFYSLHFGVC